MSQFQPRMLIGGQLVEASDKASFPIYNPATREKVADVPEATEADVNTAVAAAKDAFPAWSALDPAARGAYLKKLAALIRQNNAELALLEASSMGRPVSEYIDGFAAAGHFEHYSEAWPHIQGQSSLNTPGFVTMTWRQPYGVVGAIIPWNVPLLFFASKAAPALIAGNTVVLKSSEKAPWPPPASPSSSTKPGSRRRVQRHLGPRRTLRRGAVGAHGRARAHVYWLRRTGRLIQEVAAKTNLKKVVLELGGKSPAIVFADADVEKAVAETMHSIQWNSGQVCMANSRVYVQEDVAPRFVEAFKQKFAAVKAGNPADKEVHHGPQADEVQYKNVMGFIEEGKKTGSLALGGNGTLDATGEEVFGPVVNINTFKTEEEAVAKANDTVFGLYAAVYTKDISRALRVAKALESGYVGVNTTSPRTGRDMPFGGYKMSVEIYNVLVMTGVPSVVLF
ncbi:unnamed protein product [Parascedosporium putredinis]|uniref:aldehyde dehydrogenase (NAD(+)) n=1 Tax=Parascedosporium putredinis TaxID=1442378 RepID=A0A9P1H142_9PEZI|nr:unnamed protein product [Parascedosporium putredinis]CAI7993433.1 unnamed protein product [Parascedosporium putredinis]